MVCKLELISLWNRS